MFGATLSFQDPCSGASVRVPAALLIVSFTLACGHPSATPEASPVAGVAQGWPYLGKSRVTASRQAMVVSGSPIASEVGRNILQQGGNAVDAAVAVGFALAVVHPEAGNIGGGGLMIIRPQDRRVYALDYRANPPAPRPAAVMAWIGGNPPPPGPAATCPATRATTRASPDIFRRECPERSP